MNIIGYTDASFLCDDKKSAVGVLYKIGKKIFTSSKSVGEQMSSTHAELSAIELLCKYVQRRLPNEDINLKVYTDSLALAYAFKGKTSKIKKFKDVPISDLMRRIRTLRNNYPRIAFNVRYIQGHASNPYNNYVHDAAIVRNTKNKHLEYARRRL